MVDDIKIEDMTIEQANAELESMVKQLENEALPMSESVAVYARACELLGYCMDKLNNYQGKIRSINEALAARMAEENNAK